MGFFKSMRRSTSNLTPSPKQPSSPVITPPAVVPDIPVIPLLRLRVAVHPSSNGISGEKDLFWIEVDPEDGIEAIRELISMKIGRVAIGVFKVSIPHDAFQQASEYARRYNDRVDLISHFSAFSLDDPTQLGQSLGSAGWQVQLPTTRRIKDWWPSPPSNTDLISIIARPIYHAPASSKPLTLLAHFAPLDHIGSSPSSSSRTTRRPPTPVDILPTDSILQLKAAILHADGRTVDKIDKVVLWRVDMSEQEMIVIEERGGLKAGQMPWPYPPTAEVPTAISNDHLPISHYFPEPYYSNMRMVSISIWIHPSASTLLSRIPTPESIDAPIFRYPMILPVIEVSPPRLSETRRNSACHSLPSDSPPLQADPIIPTNSLPSRISGRSRRGRPSTAPAACDFQPQTPSFGLRSLSRGRSPLAPPAPTHQTSAKNSGTAGSALPPIPYTQQTDHIEMDMKALQLDVQVGTPSIQVEAPADGKIIWQPAVGSLRRSDSQPRGIRSLANIKALRAHEVC